ncbi:hypothetical protein K0M31_013663 [Melipona bicolor]|uniref:Uncharacterized protein n=1 Tax=Melipona bicolor TaxID=60889 RepID=A0AA40FHU5_9HYME|nr:hypothetical protein K0M31_013663 [Melipona bicolor]
MDVVINGDLVTEAILHRNSDTGRRKPWRLCIDIASEDVLWRELVATVSSTNVKGSSAWFDGAASLEIFEGDEGECIPADKRLSLCRDNSNVKLAVQWEKSAGHVGSLVNNARLCRLPYILVPGFYTSHESASVRYARRSEGIGGGISQDRRIGYGEWFAFSERSNTKRAVSRTAVCLPFAMRISRQVYRSLVKAPYVPTFNQPT